MLVFIFNFVNITAMGHACMASKALANNCHCIYF